MQSPSFALYINPTNGSMVLQLVLGGVSGVFVAARILKQKIRRVFRGRESQAEADSPADR